MHQGSGRAFQTAGNDRQLNTSVNYDFFLHSKLGRVKSQVGTEGVWMGRLSRAIVTTGARSANVDRHLLLLVDLNI